MMAEGETKGKLIALFEKLEQTNHIRKQTINSQISRQFENTEYKEKFTVYTHEPQ